MDLREKNLRRIGSRHHLHFYVDVKCNCLVPHNNAEEVRREATDAEVCMWEELCPEDPSQLPATSAEVENSLARRKGPFTVNPIDFIHIRLSPWFNPEEDPEKRQEGLYGSLSGEDIYVSRMIPIGFFYQGPRIPTLHTGSDAKGPRSKDSIPADFDLWLLDIQSFSM
jgi:hypothetical protein